MPVGEGTEPCLEMDVLVVREARRLKYLADRLCERITGGNAHANDNESPRLLGGKLEPSFHHARGE